MGDLTAHPLYRSDCACVDGLGHTDGCIRRTHDDEAKHADAMRCARTILDVATDDEVLDYLRSARPAPAVDLEAVVNELLDHSMGGEGKSPREWFCAILRRHFGGQS